MSIRFRRSMKLIPGVRLNINKDSLGLSFGVPGARYSVNTKGRRTASVGIPGTGLYSVQTLSSGRKSSRASSPEVYQPEERYLIGANPITPGVFAKKSEKEFHKFLNDIYATDSKDSPAQVLEKAKVLRAQYDDLRTPLELISFLHAIGDEALYKQAQEWAPALWKNHEALFAHPLAKKYFVGLHPQIQISRGVMTNMTYNARTFAFIYAEILQDQKKYKEALEIIDFLEPDQLTAISTADIELTAQDFDAAIETTEDIENEDDGTAMLLILRGIAFRGKSLHEASLECFKRALAKKGRSVDILNRAHYERAETYIAMGKKAMAVKDLEKILVDDPSYAGVAEKLDSLR
jgi:tetratricopeptide (TPR) repeat protein